MDILTSFAAPGHGPWDALIILILAALIYGLARARRGDQLLYGDQRDRHAAAALQATPDQAHAIAALGPVPAPRGFGLLIALLVAGLALFGAGGKMYAEGRSCDPPCLAGQTCRSGVCTGTADARLMSWLYPLPNAAARELPSGEDADRRAPLPEPRREPAVTKINFGGEP